MSQTQATASQKFTDTKNPSDQDQPFQSSEQTVGKPGLSGNLNDEYFRNPPQNQPLDSVSAKDGGQDFGNKAEKREEYIVRVLPRGAMGEQVNGRIKQMDVERSMVIEDEEQ